MAKKPKLTRVVIYLNNKRAKTAERHRAKFGHKNINRFVSYHVNDWLDSVMP